MLSLTPGSTTSLCFFFFFLILCILYFFFFFLYRSIVDEERELSLIRASPGGLEGLQHLITSSIVGACCSLHDDSAVPHELNKYLLGFKEEMHELCRNHLSADRERLKLSLVAAAGGGHADAVGLLLQTLQLQPTALVNWPDPIIAASRGGHLVVLRMLIQACGQHSRRAVNSERSNLHPIFEEWCAASDPEKNCGWFFARDGTSKLRDGWSRATVPMPVTPLIAAAGRGQLESVRFLLQMGADSNKGDRSDSWYPLHASLHGKNSQVTQLLLDSGAKVNLRTCGGRGFSALMVAAAEGNVDSARLLLDSGACASTRRTRCAGTRPIRFLAHLMVGFIMYWLFKVTAFTDYSDEPIDLSIFGIFPLIGSFIWIGILGIEFRPLTALRDAIANEDEEMILLLRPKTWTFVCCGMYLS
jgi:hypothetical protein